MSASGRWRENIKISQLARLQSLEQKAEDEKLIMQQVCDLLSKTATDLETLERQFKVCDMFIEAHERNGVSFEYFNETRARLVDEKSRWLSKA